jgi:hypothetical protein
MDLYVIASQQVIHTMREQFRDAPETSDPVPQVTRPGVMTTTRLRLSASLHALAAAVEPRPSASRVTALDCQP